MNYTDNKKEGFVLISALLFATVLAILALVILESLSLEPKMTYYFNQKELAFVAAEKDLKMKEMKIEKGLSADGSELIEDEICGVEFYRVTGNGKSRGVNVLLESYFAKKVLKTECKTSPDIIFGRQSWREL